MKFPLKSFFCLIALPITIIANNSCAANELLVSESIEIDQNLIFLFEAVSERDVESLWELKDNLD